MLTAYLANNSNNYEVLSYLKATQGENSNEFVSYYIYSGLTQMIGESVQYSENLDAQLLENVNNSITQLHGEAPENLVINAPESKLLYLKALSYADPAQFTMEFEQFIENSITQAQRNKILVFLGNKINEVAKPFEKNRAENACKTFVSRVLREEDFKDYWNASLNAQAFWEVEEKTSPEQAVYMRELLSGINDRLGYKLEKEFALRWEKREEKRIAAQQAKEAELAEGEEEETEAAEETEGEEDSKNIKFNLDYFAWVLQHREFALTAKDIIDMDMDKIRSAYILDR